VYYGLTINLPVTQGIVVYVVAFGYIDTVLELLHNSAPN